MLDYAGEYFGSGKVSVKTDKFGDKVFVSEDQGRKIRFDINNTGGDRPHMHFERKTQSGEWVDYYGQHRFYFGG